MWIFFDLRRKGAVTSFLQVSLISAFIITMLSSEAYSRQFSIEAESGAYWFSRNDVRVPNEGGTKFSMINLVGYDASVYYRLRLHVTLGKSHHFRILYAPLKISGTGFFDSPVLFGDASFERVTPIQGAYTFNTYRFTYRYTFYDRNRWTLGAGAAALIRDAKIELIQGDNRESTTDSGFVPLLHLHSAFRIYSDLSVVFDAESLASTRGRATDAALFFDYRVADNLRFHLGYRVLEGGADVEEVYNFSWINFGLIGLRITL